MWKKQVREAKKIERQAEKNLDDALSGKTSLSKGSNTIEQSERALSDCLFGDIAELERESNNILEKIVKNLEAYSDVYFPPAKFPTEHATLANYLSDVMNRSEQLQGLQAQNPEQEKYLLHVTNLYNLVTSHFGVWMDLEMHDLGCQIAETLTHIILDKWIEETKTTRETLKKEAEVYKAKMSKSIESRAEKKKADLPEHPEGLKKVLNYIKRRLIDKFGAKIDEDTLSKVEIQLGINECDYLVAGTRKSYAEIFSELHADSDERLLHLEFNLLEQFFRYALNEAKSHIDERTSSQIGMVRSKIDGMVQARMDAQDASYRQKLAEVSASSSDAQFAKREVKKEYLMDLLQLHQNLKQDFGGIKNTVTRCFRNLFK